MYAHILLLKNITYTKCILQNIFRDVLIRSILARINIKYTYESGTETVCSVVALFRHKSPYIWRYSIVLFSYNILKYCMSA